MKSSRELQREAEAQRNNLADTLDRLSDNLTPSHITSEALSMARDSGLTIAKSLAESARANPVPALLIGVGLTMLLTRDSGHGGSSGGSSSAGTGGDLVGKAGEILKSAWSAGTSTVRQAADAVGSTGDDAHLVLEFDGQVHRSAPVRSSFRSS